MSFFQKMFKNLSFFEIFNQVYDIIPLIFNELKGKIMKETLASVLKEARLHAGFLQEDAAKYLGVRRSTIGNYENGRSKPNIERFILLCKFYKVDFVRLFIRLYGDNYIPEKTRDSLLESISEEILHQDTVVLQNIEWILSAKHGVPNEYTNGND